MGKIVASDNVSLDGVVQDPAGDEGFRLGGWVGKITDRPELAKLTLEEALGTSALLLGRRSYQWFAARWPSRSGELADRINTMPKYIVSSTLEDPDWTNSTVLTGDVVDEVSRLKKELNGEIVIWASFQLVRTLMEHDLVDELREDLPGGARSRRATVRRDERHETHAPHRHPVCRWRSRSPHLRAGTDLLAESGRRRFPGPADLLRARATGYRRATGTPSGPCDPRHEHLSLMCSHWRDSSNARLDPICSTTVDSVSSESMDLPQRAQVHSALGDEARLELVDLLIEGDLSVRELAGALEMPGNLLAHHLNVLNDAGVIERRQSEGDRRRRYVTLRRQALAELNLAPVPIPLSSVVFVCSHNSARSQYAAAYWTSRTGRVATSAGVNPAPAVHPLAIRVAKERGLDLRGAQPSGYDSLTRVPELLISVCDKAREARLPSAERHIHWSISDPVAVRQVGAFRSAFDDIEHRVDSLVS